MRRRRIQRLSQRITRIKDNLCFDFTKLFIRGNSRDSRAEKSSQNATNWALPQRGRFFVAAFQLKHHPLDVPVVLVPAQELQTFLRIAPLQNLNSFLASAPRIHFTLIRHV